MDGRAEVITISPSLFKKSVGIKILSETRRPRTLIFGM